MAVCALFFLFFGVQLPRLGKPSIMLRDKSLFSVAILAMFVLRFRALSGASAVAPYFSVGALERGTFQGTAIVVPAACNNL